MVTATFLYHGIGLLVKVFENLEATLHATHKLMVCKSYMETFYDC